MLEKKNENEMSIPNLYYLRNFEIASPEPGDVIRIKRFCCNKFFQKVAWQATFWGRLYCTICLKAGKIPSRFLNKVINNHI